MVEVERRVARITKASKGSLGGGCSEVLLVGDEDGDNEVEKELLSRKIEAMEG